MAQYSPWTVGTTIRLKGTYTTAVVLEWPDGASHPSADTFARVDGDFSGKFIRSEYWEASPYEAVDPNTAIRYAIENQVARIAGKREPWPINSSSEVARVLRQLARETK
jgi:hypothetical protein